MRMNTTAGDVASVILAKAFPRCFRVPIASDSVSA